MGAVDQGWPESVFTGGRFDRSRAGAGIPVREKAAGEIFALAGLADAAGVDAGVAVATTAQTECGGRTYAERAAVLRGAAATLTDRAKRTRQFRDLIIGETGCIGGLMVRSVPRRGAGGRSTLSRRIIRIEFRPARLFRCGVRQQTIQASLPAREAELRSEDERRGFRAIH